MVDQIKKIELRNWTNRGIYRAIILADSKEAIERFNPEATGLVEQLIIPYTKTGIKLINTLGQEDISLNAVKSIYPGEPITLSRSGISDYTVGDILVVVLITNDIEKQSKLSNYLGMSQYRYTNKVRIDIVCLESQKYKFQKQFPGCNIKPIAEEEILK